MEKIMAILVEESAYAERLAAYTNLCSATSLTVVPFVSAREFLTFLEKKPVQILLADAGQLDALQKEEAQTGSTLRAGRLIGLSAGDGAEGEEAESLEDSLLACDAVINKYQPADALLRAVMENCQDLRIRRFLSERRNARLIGIYSPVGRCGKTSLALTLCRFLSRRERVLYLNFETFSGIQQFTQSSSGTTLSDALYHLKQGSLNEQRICTLVRTFSGIEYIPPIQFADDVQAASEGELAELIETIFQESGYRTIVADIGFFSESAGSLLELCKEILMPVLEDPLSKAKITEFETYIELSGKTALREKLHKIMVPNSNLAQVGENYVDLLLYGPIGDLVRELYAYGTDENREETV